MPQINDDFWEEIQTQLFIMKTSCMQKNNTWFVDASNYFADNLSEKYKDESTRCWNIYRNLLIIRNYITEGEHVSKLIREQEQAQRLKEKAESKRAQDIEELAKKIYNIDFRGASYDRYLAASKPQKDLYREFAKTSFEYIESLIKEPKND